MAVIDPRDDSVVIRIVYDGAPLAGKTTSVCALGRGLGAPVYSPAALEGRTLYFDWLDYTGGLFEGRRIRCQIVSVPGQATLAPRRRRLLEHADAVVFVGDSTPEGTEADGRYLAALANVLAARTGPPIGIVMQANKRDLPNAVPLEQLRGVVEKIGLRIAVVESVATDGSGIREAFVFAVRLALDRVRELMRSNALESVTPEVDSGEDLLRELKSKEDGALDLAVDNGLKHTRLNDLSETMAASALREAIRDDAPAAVSTAPAPTSSEQTPAPPDARVASGLVWPPIDGRVILHEASSTPPQLRRSNCGSWSGVAARHWKVHSAQEGCFATLDEGRSALIAWARAHTAAQDTLSKDRCVALAADAGRGFRLWQVVKTQESLRQKLERSMNESAQSLAGALIFTVRTFRGMAEKLAHAPCELPLSLGNIALTDEGFAYAGLMPLPEAMRPARALNSKQVGDDFVSELGDMASVLRTRRAEVLPQLVKLARGANAPTHDEWELLQRLASLMRKH